MIAHALEIIKKELQANLDLYPVLGGGPNFKVEIDNIATYSPSSGNGGGDAKDVLLTIINLKEEKTLKNIPSYTRNDVTQKAEYENPPIFLNFLLLFTVVRNPYTIAMNILSRVIRCFQTKNVFTQQSVAPGSLLFSPAEDQLVSFKLILDLYSPTLEEVNHLWGTLGGKQYPSVLYVLRMLDLKFKVTPVAGPLILTVESEVLHKDPSD